MIKAKQKENKREQVPAGTHIARCYSMIHIGTTTWEYLGEKRETDKVRISFELPNELRTFSEENGEQPMVIDKEYNLTMFEKANLRKDLESWRGKAFSEKEAKDFDILKLIGVPCSLGVIHKDTAKGTTYARIGSISGLPKGMKAPDQINETQIFDYNENFDPNIIEELPGWIQDQIKETPEWKEATSEDEIEPQNKPNINQKEEEDCPF